MWLRNRSIAVASDRLFESQDPNEQLRCAMFLLSPDTDPYFKKVNYRLATELFTVFEFANYERFVDYMQGMISWLTERGDLDRGALKNGKVEKSFYDWTTNTDGLIGNPRDIRLRVRELNETIHKALLVTTIKSTTALQQLSVVRSELITFTKLTMLSTKGRQNEKLTSGHVVTYEINREGT